MFCPNCGMDCRESKFCPECGTDLRKQDKTEGVTISEVDNAAKTSVDMDIPIGKYNGTLGYVELRDTEIFIHKKVLFKTVETSIQYVDIAAVAYQKAKGLGTGFLSIRSRQERFTPLADQSNAASDKTELVFGNQVNAPMFQVYQFLQVFAEKNAISCATADVPDQTVSSGSNPSLNTCPIDMASSDTVQPSDICSIDMDEYFERFNPNKIAAIKAIVREKGIDMRQAKELVDREFAHRQKIIYAAQPDAAMRDLKRALNPQKAEWYERKAELDKQGIAYCPKCLSTSITGDKKGFGIGKAVVGAYLVGGLGLMAGNINAKKVRLTCMKCGYQWMAGKK